MKVIMKIKNIKNFSFKKKVILFVLLLVLIKGTFSVYAYFFQEPNPEFDANQLETSKAHRSDLFETVKVLGKSNLVDEQKLRFNLTGRVTVVNFAAGSSVKKGDIIAELDKSDVENDIKQAEITLQNAEIDLDNLLKGGGSLNIKRAENSLEYSKVNLDLEKRSLDLAKEKMDEEIANLDQKLEQTEDDFITKTTNLNDAKTKLNNVGIFYAETNSFEDPYFLAKDSNLGLNGIILAIDDVVNNLDNLFDEDLNYQYRSNLGVLDSNTLNVANINYNKSTKEKEKIKAEFDRIYDEKLTIAELDIFLNELKQVLRLLVEASDSAYEVLDKSESGESFSQASLNSLKSTFSGLRTSSESKVTEIEQISQKIIQEQENYRLAQNTFKVAKEDLEEFRHSLPRLKNDQKIAYEKAKNQHNELIKKVPEDEENLVNLKRSEGESITRAKNAIVLQKLVLEKTNKNISKYELSAPFDGVIRKIDFKVGDNLINDESKYAYLENSNILKITILLDQIEAIKVLQGQTAEIVFDALPKKIFIGQIDEINQSPKDEGGKISYEATLTLEKEGERIFSGMTASVTIFVNEKKNVLVIPVLAVKDGFVQKMVNGLPVETPVETGMDNGVDIEMISGLEEDDEVVVIDYMVLDDLMKINY